MRIERESLQKEKEKQKFFVAGCDSQEVAELRRLLARSVEDRVALEKEKKALHEEQESLHQENAALQQKVLQEVKEKRTILMQETTGLKAAILKQRGMPSPKDGDITVEGGCAAQSG